MLSERAALSKPPLNILLNPKALRTQRPWEIDLNSLLEAFLKTLEAWGSPDLRLCGHAALTSALLYRLKVETMFLFERLKPERLGDQADEPPRIILLPFRYELRATALEELLGVLEKVVQDVLSEASTPKPTPVMAEVEPQLEIDAFLANIREMLVSFKVEVQDALRGSGRFFFSEFTRELTPLEKARRFIMILFLAMEGVVRLEQAGEDIVIGGMIESASV